MAKSTTVGQCWTAGQPVSHSKGQVPLQGLKHLRQLAIFLYYVKKTNRHRERFYLPPSSFIHCCLVWAEEICQQVNGAEIELQGETGGTRHHQSHRKDECQQCLPTPTPLLPVHLLHFTMQRGVSSSRSRLLMYVIQQRSQLTFYLLDSDPAEAYTMTVSHLMAWRRLLTWQSHHCTGSSVTTD